ncbi:hypothetical protein V6N12_069140 [Hibiscus sabdariffa]|uniref:Uncharacterized protein n=1 Tax=Hibiscus sabdariffa TaxID=183260 RepID=A0ABR2FDD2_9ROSI
MLLTNSRTHDQVDFLVSLIKLSSLENELLRFPKPGDNAPLLKNPEKITTLILDHLNLLVSTNRLDLYVVHPNKQESKRNRKHLPESSQKSQNTFSRSKGKSAHKERDRRLGFCLMLC